VNVLEFWANLKFIEDIPRGLVKVLENLPYFEWWGLSLSWS
jgi:hypothetical protein